MSSPCFRVEPQTYKLWLFHLVVSIPKSHTEQKLWGKGMNLESWKAEEWTTNKVEKRNCLTTNASERPSDSNAAAYAQCCTQSQLFIAPSINPPMHTLMNKNERFHEVYYTLIFFTRQFDNGKFYILIQSRCVCEQKSITKMRNASSVKLAVFVISSPLAYFHFHSTALNLL